MDVSQKKRLIPLRTAGIMVAKYISRVSGYVLLGFCVNLGVLLTRLDALVGLKNGQPLDASQSGMVFILVVTLLFPMVYLMLGHRQGLSAAGYYAAKTCRVPLAECFVRQAFKEHPEWLDNLQQTATGLKERLQDRQKSVKTARFSERLVYAQLNALFSRVFSGKSIGAVLDEVIALAAAGEGSAEDRIQTLSKGLAGKINLARLAPSKFAPGWVVAGNLSAVYFIAPFLPNVVELAI